MSRRLVLVFLMLGLGTVGMSARESGSTNGKKEAAARLARLVAELGSDDFATREAALQALEAAGPAARPTLESALLSPDPEVRRLAREVAERLARRAEAVEMLEPKRLRVAYRDVPLSVVVQDFARVSGCRIVLDPATSARLADKKITLDTGLTSFWDGFEQLCRVAGLTEKKPEPQATNVVSYSSRGGRLFKQQPDFGGGGGRSGLPGISSAQMTLMEGERAALPSFHAGALRVRALPPGSPLGSGTATKGDEEVFVGLEVVSEPSIGWQGVQSLRIEKALDDQGQLLAHTQAFQNTGQLQRPNEEAMWESSYAQVNYGNVPGGGEHVPARLRLGKKAAHRLVELRGLVTVRLQTAPQPIATIDNVLRSSGQSAKGADGTHLRLLEVQRDEGSPLRLRVQIEPPQAENANAWGWGIRRFGWSGGSDGGLRDLVLYDANGHLIRQTGAENLDDGTGGPMDYRISFQPAPGQAEPARLVWQGRRGAVIDVPFVLRDVPLR